jgi:putative flippase GtrA
MTTELPGAATPPGVRPGPAPRLVGQLLRFAGVGAASTLAYAVLYLAMRPLAGAFPANALALLLTAVANTAANRRLTFGARGGTGAAGDHVVGLVAFGAGLLVTSGALALLHLADPAAGRGTELAVLVVAGGFATVLRFVVLRRRIVPAGADRAAVRRPPRSATPAC